MKKNNYSSIHQWLIKNFGNPARCEKCGKVGMKQKGVRKNHWNIQWAKIKNKEYGYKRDNFWGLCANCHIKYDYTKERGDKIRLTNIKKIQSGEFTKHLRIAWAKRREKVERMNT